MDTEEETKQAYEPQPPASPLMSRPPPPPSTPLPSAAAATLLSTPAKTPLPHYTTPLRTDITTPAGFSTPLAATTSTTATTMPGGTAAAGAASPYGASSASHHHHHHHHHGHYHHSNNNNDNHNGEGAAEGKQEENEDDRDKDCPICMSPLASRSIYKTRCNHAFHRSCMVESRGHHNNGCPYCRGEITPGLTPFDACPGRIVSGRDQIISRARAARQAVLTRMQQRQGRRSLDFAVAGGGGGGGVLLAEESPQPHQRSLLREAFEEAEEGSGGVGMSVGVVGGGGGVGRQSVSTEELGHRIDHLEDDLPH